MKHIRVLETISGEGDSIYLAGPTYRITKKENLSHLSWRWEALKILEENNFKGTVYIPEWRDGVKPLGWTYSRQVDWELQAMKSATIILFWIPREMNKLPAFTTNIEFGEWFKSDKIVIGSPEESPKNQYLKERCSRYSIHWFLFLRTCVNYALRKIVEERTNVWFTSDTHFGHQRTLELSRRPFNSIKEMDWEIVKRWNSKVTDDDMVYHLGDFGNPEMIRYLKGKNIIIKEGNYDTNITDELIKDTRVSILISDEPLTIFVGADRKEFNLIHAPEQGKDPSVFYLFGHIHNLQMIKRNGLNVGVDCHNFTPINDKTIMFYRNAIMNHYDENVFMDILK